MTLPDPFYVNPDDMPRIDELWQTYDGSPWPTTRAPVRIVDVRDGWVRFSPTDWPADMRSLVSTFVRCHQRVPS